MMRKLSKEETIINAKKYELVPARIHGKEVVQLIKKSDKKFEEISWDEFFEILAKKRLAVYISKNGYVKIMGDDVYE